MEIGIAYLDIERGFSLLFRQQLQRTEHRLRRFYLPKVTDPVVLVGNERPFAVMQRKVGGERMEFALRGALFLRLRPLPVGLLRYLRLLRNVAGNLLSQLGPPLRRQGHHGLVEAIYRRIAVPVQFCIHSIVGVGSRFRFRRLLGRRHRSRCGSWRYELRPWRCRLVRYIFLD